MFYKNLTGKGTLKKKKGMNVMEIIIFMVVVALMVPVMVNISKVMKTKSNIEVTKEKEKVINNVSRGVWMKNLQYVQANCEGWEDQKCANISLTPEVSANDNTVLIFRTHEEGIIKTLENIGCDIVKNGQTEYYVSCMDGFGDNFEFNAQFSHEPGKKYLSPYKGEIFQLDIHSKKGMDVSYRFDDLVSTGLATSQQRFVDFANGIKKVVRNIRLNELSNDCTDGGTPQNPSGGLGSWDDAMVPWVWKIHSQTPFELCQGVEDSNTGCGCQNHQNVDLWNDDPALCEIDEAAKWESILKNLTLGEIYKFDGFGNLAKYVPLSDELGQPVDCPPPRPVPNYPATDSIGKGRIGVFDLNDGAWYGYIDIVTE